MTSPPHGVTRNRATSGRSFLPSRLKDAAREKGKERKERGKERGRRSEYGFTRGGVASSFAFPLPGVRARGKVDSALPTFRPNPCEASNGKFERPANSSARNSPSSHHPCCPARGGWEASCSGDQIVEELDVRVPSLHHFLPPSLVPPSLSESTKARLKGTEKGKPSVGKPKH